MKKRRWTLLILTIALLMAGCASSAEKEAVMVEELPIERTEGDGAAAAEDTEPDVDPAAVALEKEALEEIEVEVDGENGTITVGTIGAPYTEILTQAKIQLAKEGWDLQIEKYDDYQKLNEDVLNGTLDAHLFAHQTYVDSYNDVHGTSLQSIGSMCYEVYGVYSKINQDLTKIKDASSVGIPADDTRKARTLLFMEDLGWIVLKENVGMTAIEEDIMENAKNLQFIEYDQNSLESVMEETDYCIIGADTAILAGINIEEDILRKETSTYKSAKTFATMLVAAEENVQSEKMTALAATLRSKEIRDYMEETYRGAYAVFE